MDKNLKTIKAIIESEKADIYDQLVAEIEGFEAELREKYKEKLEDHDPDFFNLIKEILGE